MKKIIKIAVIVEKPINKVWKYWTDPEHIVNWNFANDDWECPEVTNDLKTQGSFNFRMEAKDQSMGFNFNGEYTEVELHNKITYKIGDGRMVWITFEEKDGGTILSEAFEIEDENAAELQKQGWQAILNNFKFYTENS